MDFYDPHAIICDLDFGPGPSGVDLLVKVHRDRPWVGLVVFTSYLSPALAIGSDESIPEGVVYLVKPEVENLSDILSAVDLSVTQAGNPFPVNNHPEAATLTPAQAEILHLIAEGLSNSGIAKHRGISLRATEAMVQRTFQALGISTDPDYNARILAVRKWQQGNIRVK